MMQKWCADNLDVAGRWQPWGQPILVQAVVLLFWMTLIVMDMSLIFGRALTVAGESITVTTMKMLVSSAQVCSDFVIEIFDVALLYQHISNCGCASIFFLAQDFFNLLISSQVCKSCSHLLPPVKER